MKPTIYLAFVDDWELSGNGSGDARVLQYEPMRELVKIYNAHGVKGSFNAEVMQQLTFRKFETDYPELKTLADEWDEVVKETYSQGHDIQLHIHPQWQNAKYENGCWRLTADWSVLNYSPEEAYQMMSAGKEYLEKLLRPLNPAYACVSFRSGSWCIAPSPHMLNLLIKLGIIFDMSIVGGVCYETKNINLDYTNCDEDFLPYYPVMTDARRVSDKEEPIICVPTNHFYGSRRQVFKHHLGKALEKVKRRIAPAAVTQKSSRSSEVYGQEWAQTRHASTLTRVYEKGIVPYLKGKHLISDIAQLDYALLREMLASIRRRARASGLDSVPVILENHTKDIRDFSDIERFIKDVSQAEDIQCLTLTELAKELQNGKFQIRTAVPK
ncbi:MAG: hypothetical protein QOH25_1591 [Acidobacteriota bacterium]|jgi:hypothetical protein|nr:hypothetical protein [Acidobacteriota bacterium]